MTIRKEKKEGKQRRKQMVTTCIVIIIFILLLFLKMKEGTYGCGDFNKFFNQTKQEILEKNGEPIQREALNDDCECIAFDGVDYIFILDSFTRCNNKSNGPSNSFILIQYSILTTSFTITNYIIKNISFKGISLHLTNCLIYIKKILKYILSLN